MKTPTPHAAGGGRKVPLVRCPGKCKEGWHPATMQYCPYTHVPLHGSLPVKGRGGGAHSGGDTGSGEKKVPFWKTPRFWKRVGIVSLVLLFFCAVGGILAALHGEKGQDLPPIAHESARSQAIDLGDMVPIRTLTGTGNAPWIDTHEVSIREYRAVMGSVPKQPAGFTDTMPVVNVSYAQAREFAAKAGKRLCTETEWKAAAGLGPGGQANFQRAVTSSVGGAGRLHVPQDNRYEMDRSPIGAFNLLGNVREWIAVPEGSPPQTLGAAWTDTSVSAASVGTPVSQAGGAPEATTGFRCCLTRQEAPGRATP